MRFMAAHARNAFRVGPTAASRTLLASNGQSGALRALSVGAAVRVRAQHAAGRASAQVFANVLRDALDGARENSDLLLPRADLGQLFPEPAAAFVTRARRLDPPGRRGAQAGRGTRTASASTTGRSASAA